MNVSVLDGMFYASWWTNFLVYVYEYTTVTVKEALEEYDSFYVTGNKALCFRSDADAAAFILKWGGNGG